LATSGKQPRKKRPRTAQNLAPVWIPAQSTTPLMSDTDRQKRATRRKTDKRKQQIQHKAEYTGEEKGLSPTMGKTDEYKKDRAQENLHLI